MRPLPVFLALSLAANGAFVAVFLVRGSSGARTPAATGDLVSAVAPAGLPARSASAGAQTATDNLPALVAQLRAAGFSAAVVRAAVVERVREIFAARRRAIEPDGAELPFWQTDTRRRDRTLEQMTALRASYREQDALLKQLLGPDALDADAKAAQLQRYGDLPADKIAGIERLRRDYGDLMDDVQQLSRGAMLPEDREKMSYLAREERADLVKLLTPHELEDYDLRSSATANRLRAELSAFNATEKEFRTLFPLQRAFDEQVGPRTDTSSPEVLRRQNEARIQLNDQIKAALGPERFADYQRSSDPGYRQTAQLVARLELPPATANQVWAVQQDIQPRAEAIRREQSLSPEARAAQLAALATEVQAKVTAVLGTRGFDAYRQYGGGWMLGLQSRPAPPPRP